MFILMKVFSSIHPPCLEFYRSPIVSNRDEPRNIEQGTSNVEVNWAHSLPFDILRFDILRFKPPLLLLLIPYHVRGYPH